MVEEEGTGTKDTVMDLYPQNQEVMRVDQQEVVTAATREYR